MNQDVETRIAILLTTFNGEKFLARQLDSLFEQNYRNLIVVIRDDCSTDGTDDIINRYRKQFPTRIHKVENDGRNLGASGSFSLLMQYVLANKSLLSMEQAYMMCCDQDDVWLPDKIRHSIEVMHVIEQDNNQPVLIHSDLQVVDERLHQIDNSMVRYQGLRPEHQNFGRTLVANSVTGCTMLMNEALVRLATPVPEQAVMHDWWVAMVAAVGGKTRFLSAPTVKYRQHGGNTLGARQFVPGALIDRHVLQRALDHSSQDIFASLACQSSRFYELFSNQMNFWQKLLCRMCGLLRWEIPIFQKLLYRLIRAL